MPLAILTLKLIPSSNYRMLISTDPRGDATTVALTSDLDNMQSEWRIDYHDIAEHVPSMTLTSEGAIVKVIHRDPAVESAGLVGPSEGQP